MTVMDGSDWTEMPTVNEPITNRLSHVFLPCQWAKKRQTGILPRINNVDAVLGKSGSETDTFGRGHHDNSRASENLDQRDNQGSLCLV